MVSSATDSLRRIACLFSRNPDQQLVWCDGQSLHSPDCQERVAWVSALMSMILMIVMMIDCSLPPSLDLNYVCSPLM